MIKVICDCCKHETVSGTFVTGFGVYSTRYGEPDYASGEHRKRFHSCPNSDCLEFVIERLQDLLYEPQIQQSKF